jgi:Sec-independent protein translocase protein TatA
MNILGVGAEELILIVMLALIFLGPRRMLGWTYEAGKYFAQFRKMVDETMAAIRKEFDAAQIDLPKDMKGLKLPNKRFNIVDEANKLVNNELNKPSSTKPGAVASTESTTSAPAAAATVTDGTVPPAAAPIPTPEANQNGANNVPTGDSAKTDEQQDGYDAWLPK